jgi:glycosyltransferase involved in cell wall biosynthesis
MSSDLPFVSVIIPTYNRKDSLLRTLESLARQTYPHDRFEVIVVDDAAQIGTSPQFDVEAFSLDLAYLSPGHLGAADARNHGAIHSRGEILVFVDDDIVLSPTALNRLVQDIQAERDGIVIGALTQVSSADSQSVFAQSTLGATQCQLPRDGPPLQIPCVECMTGFMGLRRQHFFMLGLFQDPTGGWPSWDDVDFGYRASVAGLCCLRSVGAMAEHCDHSTADLAVACDRWLRAGHSAVRLLQRHPRLQDLLPMFHDKSPIDWSRDGLSLILRKVARQIASSRPAMALMAAAVPVLERYASRSHTLRLLYRWTISGYIYRGYRTGLREAQSLRGSR